MVRPTQFIYPAQPPAPLRPAATVLMVRDGPDGPEVLMTRRSTSASFAPGAYVFPGGGIDAADAGLHAEVSRRAGQSPLHLTQAIAAIRESFEELGVLLARHSDGRWAGQDDIDALDRLAPLAPQCAARGLQMAAAEVFVLAHWITDRDLPRRFDVPFLVAQMPEGQHPVADETEQFEPVWIRPQDALARHQAGSFLLIFPTIRTLQRLCEHTSVHSLLAACAAHEQPLWTSCPRAGWRGGEEFRCMEHEPPFGELALVCPDGQIRHALDWQHEAPVRLLKHLQRLSASNPGVMTGPGTNSYLVGEPGGAHFVIDPGPADPAHQARLLAAAGGRIEAILCTHSHPDHSPGAAVLQALCREAGLSEPPVWGMASAETARAHSRFVPERDLRDGERLCLSGATASDGQGAPLQHTLRVLHTPGHAANHLCFLLEEDGLLFTGDHVLNGSTTVIDPPDGDMDDYLQALDRLAALCLAEPVYFLLPAHGHVLGDWPHSAERPSAPLHGGAHQAILRLKAHRLAREAKVAQAVAELPDGSPQDWVRLAYSDVPPNRWPVAQRSLLAHLKRLGVPVHPPA